MKLWRAGSDEDIVGGLRSRLRAAYDQIDVFWREIQTLNGMLSAERQRSASGCSEHGAAAVAAQSTIEDLRRLLVVQADQLAAAEGRAVFHRESLDEPRLTRQRLAALGLTR